MRTEELTRVELATERIVEFVKTEILEAQEQARRETHKLYDGVLDLIMNKIPIPIVKGLTGELLAELKEIESARETLNQSNPHAEPLARVVPRNQ